MTTGFRCYIGNGKLTMFWVDIWCGNRALKLEFPRLFRLAKLKEWRVVNYSNKCGFSNVKWEDLFIRPLLNRELEILSLLKRLKVWSWFQTWRID